MQTKVLLVNVYAPNFDDVEFVNKLLSNIPCLSTHLLILGGDLNCVFNPTLDRSNPLNLTQSAMSRSFIDFMEQNGLVDPWRSRNPSTKKFSFFSPVHHSFSRIDYFLIDSALNSCVNSIDYLGIVISDHSPLLLDIQISTAKRNTSLWRFNSLLLAEREFCNFISNTVNDFLAFNQTESVSYSLLWETLKCYLRGQIISYSAFTNKNNNARINKLTSVIRNLDHLYALNPSPELLKQRIDSQAEFDRITTKEAERLLLCSRSTYYEHGDKASRLLAHQLKRQAASRLIPSIRNAHNVITTDPSEINATFKSYYSSLYKSEFPIDSTRMDNFLDGLSIPVVDVDIAKQLDSPLSLEEVLNAIKAMQSNKAPGPGGFPIEFFKTFAGALAPLLLSVFNESLEGGSLPPTLTQATIALLLKQDKDPASCGSYRPLSLLNADVKVLAKILASRLENVLPRIISEEQNGFIKGRQLFFNIRTLFNIIYSRQSDVLPEIVISLDAEKAFDRVEWEYLFAVLRKFGFGDKFISWIRLLYSSPKASVHTNDVYSDYFNLGRGTRQGCPLSPLLFAITIEPLSIALKSSSLFKGIVRNDTEHKLSLYADDLLLYLTNPTLSVPAVLSILENFGTFSGYKLNLAKSECFPINVAACHLQQLDLPFKLSHSGFKYLGINVTRSLSGLAAANFTPLISRVTSDIQRWGNLPLSLIGRINVIKMNILPKFLFLFQSIPLFLPKHFFDSLDQIICSFIWGGKPPRLRKIMLQRSRLSGGLALPNFQVYYWSAHIHKICYWLVSPGSSWCKIESSSCKDSSLSALLYSSLPTKPSLYTDNQVVLNTLKIWYQFRRHFKFNSASSLSPLHNNHLFPPSILDSAFSLWADKGITQCKHLYVDGVFDSFANLSSRHGLPGTHLFRYFQVRNFVAKCLPSFPSLPLVQCWETMLSMVPHHRGVISKLYNLIMSISDYSDLKLKGKWEEELGIQMEEGIWEQAVDGIRSTTSCARLGLIQFKVLYRAHFSKSRLSKLYPEVKDVCDRCYGSPCDLSHMFFLCPALKGFWTGYFTIMTTVLGVQVQPCALIAIFGVSDRSLALGTMQSGIIAFTSLLARRCLLLLWKSTKPPSISCWLRDVMLFLKLEKIRYTQRGCTDTFFQKWQPFISYFSNLKVLPG
uniref:Reverse transcriptase domain-containing protein n=1 Tax=Pygocentrus nattereri TaxID=42514 RepID=A0AAR2KLP1_PYGNA